MESTVETLGAMPGNSPERSVSNCVGENGCENIEISFEKTSRNMKPTYFGYTKEQLPTVIIFGLANLFANTIYSLQAPFYPKEAEEKGGSSIEYGFVLGIFQLVVFFMSPIFGKILGFVNLGLIFNLGIFTTSTCAFLFGFLDYLHDHVTFITLSFVLRILQGCGEAAFITSSCAIIAHEFPDAIATTFATFQTCCGIGLIVGPCLGGVLYQLGGFKLPFMSMGGCLFFVAILTYFLLPDVKPDKEKKNEDESQQKKNEEGTKSGVISMLSIPVVFLGYFSIFISTSSIGFVVATLEPHLRENFGLSPAMTGLIFTLDGVVYALCAPVWGKLCDKYSETKLFTIFGALLTFTGSLFIGPAPFLPLPTLMWLTCTGMVIHGLGIGATFVASFILALKGSINNGFPEGLAAYGLVSGLFSSSCALGFFVGPTVGGVLLDNYGFKISSLYMLITQALVAESKGATATEYGFVLGIFQLVVFIMSPIYGHILGVINPRVVFYLGIFATAICAVSFGFLDHIDGLVPFLALSFILRILQACGDAAFTTASWSIVAIDFPNTVATTFATLETCSGIGLILGPCIGGILFQIGGFFLPFLFMGSCYFAVGLLALFLLPEPDKEMTKSENEEQKQTGEHKSGVVSMLSIPTVLFGFFSIFISSSSIGFLVATLEPHLRENFELIPAMAGLVFMIDGGVYAMFAPTWGKMCDQTREVKIFTVVGALLTFTGFLFIGPAPFIPLPTLLWLTCAGLTIHGLGLGASMVSSFVLAMNGAVENGFPESVSTYGLVSGLFSSSFALGSFVGPTIGGIFLDHFGFKISSLYVLITQIIVVFLALAFMCTPRKFKLRISPSKVSNTEENNLINNEQLQAVSFNSLQREADHEHRPGKTSNSKDYRTF